MGTKRVSVVKLAYCVVSFELPPIRTGAYALSKEICAFVCLYQFHRLTMSSGKKREGAINCLLSVCHKRYNFKCLYHVFSHIIRHYFFP